MKSIGKTTITFTHPKIVNETFRLKDELKEINNSLTKLNFKLDLFLHKVNHHKKEHRHNPIPARLRTRLATINEKITQFTEIYNESGE